SNVPVPAFPELEFVLDADTERRRRGQPPRVTFLGRRAADPEHQLSGILELPRQHVRACATGTFQLHDGIRDKLRPIVVTLAYALRGPGGARRGRGAALPPLPPAL
ncbi:ITA7 protein, partial [Neodrepanis coruscans]|nr:ITA7 protein [Neodrepanis coruscans]